MEFDLVESGKFTTLASPDLTSSECLILNSITSLGADRSITR